MWFDCGDSNQVVPRNPPALSHNSSSFLAFGAGVAAAGGAAGRASCLAAMIAAASSDRDCHLQLGGRHSSVHSIIVSPSSSLWWWCSRGSAPRNLTHLRACECPPPRPMSARQSVAAVLTRALHPTQQTGRLMPRAECPLAPSVTRSNEHVRHMSRDSMHLIRARTMKTGYSARWLRTDTMCESV